MPIAGINRLGAKRSRDDDATRVAGVKANILLVDDYPGNLAALKAILDPLGHRLIMVDIGPPGDRSARA